ncbi:ABC transporter substrate-binding protein [uncultured Tessaracoccus sp.]|uniref:ABC transporter substrate-binding protein n=1 Tax=uncultured Tessaracoccus sp. TaxID=905023 RepID=UPI0025DBEB1B|nr:ABC transporter substrate-binding protein [uncultured Tessaracoccus sp.]
MRNLIVGGLVAALALTACSGAGGDASSAPADGAADQSYDIGQVQTVDEIAKLLPKRIKDKGTLVVGAAVDYAPAEFLADDLKTPIGYEVDFAKAIGKVLGVETQVTNGEFAQLLPGMGTKYDIGMSAFTITPERTANYTMIAHSQVGSSFATKKGNPVGFDPEQLCGTTIAVQNGTYQHEELGKKTKECTDAGKEAINVLVYAKHSDATTNVVGGKADAFYADSTVAGYASKLTGGQLELTGEVIEAEPQGIVVPRDDAELTKAVQTATQHLMDDGTWPKIMEQWGTSNATLTEATIHPES